MNLHIISIFPDIFQSFINCSLIGKSYHKGLINFNFINPRNFCKDKHKQIDDEIYGGGSGLLLKAEPFLDAVDDLMSKINNKNTKIILLSPSSVEFNQSKAFQLVGYKDIIFICGRYEGIDYRFELIMKEKYNDLFEKISIGKFVLMGGEIASMVIIESIVRLKPGILNDYQSIQNESYDISKGMSNIEYPQYTRPENVRGNTVPKVLLNGNHKEIEKRKKDNQKILGL